MPRDEDLVADAVRFDDDVIGAPRDDLAANGRDHVAAATASANRARCAWVRAIATASATLSCVMGASSATRSGSIRWIACLSARPDPAIELFTSCGVYSAISRPARAPHRSATPRASDTRIAVWTFLLKYRRSTARTKGRWRRMSTSSAFEMARSRSAAVVLARTSTTPHSRRTARSGAATRNAYPIPVVPGSIPRITQLGVLEDLFGNVEIRVHLDHVVELLERLNEAEELSRGLALDPDGR